MSFMRLRNTHTSYLVEMKLARFTGAPSQSSASWESRHLLEEETGKMICQEEPLRTVVMPASNAESFRDVASVSQNPIGMGSVLNKNSHQSFIYLNV